METKHSAQLEVISLARDLRGKDNNTNITCNLLIVHVTQSKINVFGHLNILPLLCFFSVPIKVNITSK